MQNYLSILIIKRGEKTEIYKNGLSIGEINAGAFKVHERIMPNGDKVSLSRTELNEISDSLGLASYEISTSVLTTPKE